MVCDDPPGLGRAKSALTVCEDTVPAGLWALNASSNVQVAPGASELPEHVLALPTNAAPTPTMARFPAVPPPVFVTVKVFGALCIPTGTEPKL
jgi:hypothetical protein